MEKFEEYIITENEFNDLKQLAENIYNTVLVIDYFVINQPEIDELYNLAPIIKNLHKDTDLMNAFFINFKKL